MSLFTDAMVRCLVESQKEGLIFLEQYDKELVERPKVSLDVVFLDADSVIKLHEGMGMQDDLRSRALLESALARAEQAAAYADPTVQEMAILIAEGIIRNHPFADGNKRTAQLALCGFLALNGESCPEDSVKTGNILLGLATRELTVEEAGQYLSLCKQVYLDLPVPDTGMNM